MYEKIPHNKSLKELAKNLRKAGNLSEVLLWLQLKNKQLNGLDFYRQKIIGNYIVDFFCAKNKVIIEVDGESHDNKGSYDEQRDIYLTALDFEIIHIQDIDIKSNLDGVITYLKYHPALQHKNI